MTSYVDEVVDFILKYPGYGHYVGANQIATREVIRERLAAHGLRCIVKDGSTFDTNALAAIENGSEDVIITGPNQLWTGWRTRADKRTLCFAEPINTIGAFVQAAQRLCGDNCRMGFVHSHSNVFQDISTEQARYYEF